MLEDKETKPSDDNSSSDDEELDLLYFGGGDPLIGCAFLIILIIAGFVFGVVLYFMYLHIRGL